MEEAFVYVWINEISGRRYVGYHKGGQEDGYICSSRSTEFWRDYEDKSIPFRREILSEGTAEACLRVEQLLLKEVNLGGMEYYNNARGSEVIFTKEVRKKMSVSGAARWGRMSIQAKAARSLKISKSKQGRPQPQSMKDKLSLLYKGKSFIQRFGIKRAMQIGRKISVANAGGKIHTEEYKKSLSNKMVGNTFGANQSAETREKKRLRFLGRENPGMSKSEETRRKISEAKKGKPSWNKGIPRKRVECPHCNKIGGEGVMVRWHFQNCKYNGREK